MYFISSKILLRLCRTAVFVLLLSFGAQVRSQSNTFSSPTPPMGWNGWDSYGTTVNAEQVKANAAWMARHLKAFGWNYIVVDIEWFIIHPTPAGNPKNPISNMDDMGRYLPDPDRFPGGFKPLADYIHSLGLKFGIHILHGIPREAVARNLPIADSPFHAVDAANSSGACRWNYDNYDLRDNPAGQAYYNSLARLYAQWGVDFIKADCISFPYQGDEIRMLSSALVSAGRPTILSLSPGPAPIEKQVDMSRHATIWRISNDIWDMWHNSEDYPQGVNDQFKNAAAWAAAAHDGHYPDADMLPLGYLGPHVGLGESRESRLTHDEQRTLLTLWGMIRSPLMMGGDLPSSDAWTIAQLTNREYLNVDQRSSDSRAAVLTDNESVWVSRPESGQGYYVAIFNRTDKSRTVSINWRQIGLPEAAYRLRNLWEHRDLGTRKSISVILPAHASVLYKATPMKAQ